VFTSFKLKAQTLLYSDFSSYQLAKHSVDGDTEAFHYLKQTDLSIMTNFIEGRLGSRVSDSSALEFVTYLPSKQPLYIVSNLQKRKQKKAPLNFFKNFLKLKSISSDSIKVEFVFGASLGRSVHLQ
jgi:hypothetical protein